MKAQEHRALGDAATDTAVVDVGGNPGDGLLLSFGDVVALSGDFFLARGCPVVPGGGAEAQAEAPAGHELAADGLFALAAVAGERGRRPSTRDEIVCALRVMAVDQMLVDPRFEPGGDFDDFEPNLRGPETEVERRVRDRFLALGASNEHFVAPGARGQEVFHDWDNTHGLALQGGGRLFGDGCLDQGVTRALPLAAVRAGVDDVEIAYRLGASGASPGGDTLHGAVREATGAPGDAFLAESRIPNVSAENPPQNWQAPDVETLWEAPIVGSGRTTVGEAAAEALEPGHELPRRLDCLGHGVGDFVGLPRSRDCAVGWATRRARPTTGASWRAWPPIPGRRCWPASVTLMARPRLPCGAPEGAGL